MFQKVVLCMVLVDLAYQINNNCYRTITDHGTNYSLCWNMTFNIPRLSTEAIQYLQLYEHADSRLLMLQNKKSKRATRETDEFCTLCELRLPFYKDLPNGTMQIEHNNDKCYILVDVKNEPIIKWNECSSSKPKYSKCTCKQKHTRIKVMCYYPTNSTFGIMDFIYPSSCSCQIEDNSPEL